MNVKTFKNGMLLLVFGISFTLTTNAQSKDRQERRTPPSATEMFAEMDANEDEKLSEDEVKGPLAENFEKIDADSDGYITKEELEKAPKPEGRKPRGRKE